MRSFGAIKTKTHLPFAFDARFRLCTLLVREHATLTRRIRATFSKDQKREKHNRGRPDDQKTQISYAPKALDRSLAAYLRCDLKANVFVYSCNCRAYLWKQLRTYAVFFVLIFIKRTFERLCEITCCRYCWQVAQKITPQK